MNRSGWLLTLLAASSVLAEHEDVVDSILQAAAKKFASPSVPFLVDRVSEQVNQVKMTFSATVSNGRMSLKSLVRDGNVVYTTDDSQATFKFQAKLEVDVHYSYDLTSGSNHLSVGKAVGTWVLSADVEVSTSNEGCQLKVAVSSKTDSFDLQLTNFQGSLCPITVHYPPGDEVERHILPTFSKNLNSAFEGWDICDIIDCNLIS